VLNSPDFEGMDVEAALLELDRRISNYVKVYEVRGG
jgi:hypothetical protein